MSIDHLELVASASRNIQRSLEALDNDDYELTALLAPIALEHLGKAALCRRHPTLLHPSNGADKNLVLLAKPDTSLSNPALRTRWPR